MASMLGLTRRPASRPLALVGGSLVAAVTLAGCTGDSPQTGDPSPTPTPEAGITQGDRVWFCGIINDQYVDSISDGLGSVARQDQLRDDATGWICEIKVAPEGEEEQVAMRMSITPVADIDEIRPEYAEADGAVEGPEHLGEAYLTPGKAVAMMPCKAPSSSEYAGQDVPYAFEVEVFTEPGDTMVDELGEALNRMRRPIDDSFGCSPSLLRDGQTLEPPAPGEGAETTAPADS